MDEKRTRVSILKCCLNKFECISREILGCYVTVDKTWIHYYLPEMKKHSKQRISSKELTSQKAKTVPSTRKIMATVFSNLKDIVLIDTEKRKNSHRTVLC